MGKVRSKHRQGKVPIRMLCEASIYRARAKFMRKRLLFSVVFAAAGLLGGPAIANALGIALPVALIVAAVAGIMIGCVVSVLVDVMTGNTGQSNS